MTKQLESFKSYLEKFATQHQNDIKKNQEFRQHFQRMCARIGVDPLACMLNQTSSFDNLSSLSIPITHASVAI